MENDEKLKTIQSAIDSILSETPTDVLHFLNKENLLDKFKKDFIEKYSQKPFNFLSYEAKVMFGDADGVHNDYTGMSFECWDYLKPWWDAYVKKYSPRRENIFKVGYDEAGVGFWDSGAISEIFKDKNAKKFYWDNNHSKCKVVLSLEDEYFENPFENCDDDPNETAKNRDDLVDYLLAYASYWYKNDKRDNALIHINDPW